MALEIRKHIDSQIEICVKNVGTVEVPVGTTLEELYYCIHQEVPYPIIAGIVDNKLIDLYHQFNESCSLEMLDRTSETGLKIYRRSAVFIMLKACRELFPRRRLIIQHSLSNGLFCQFQDGKSTQAEAQQIEQRMQDICRRDLPIQKLLLSTTDACRVFMAQGQMDKVKLLEYRDQLKVHVYDIEGLHEYFYGYMVSRTGFIDKFRVINYPPGLILQTPEQTEPGILHDYVPQPKLAGVFAEAGDWARMLQARHLADLNDIVDRGQGSDLIYVNEGLHEKKIAYIADAICENPKLRLVLISGPSSSGKTTFAQRLLVQLKVNGRKPVSISLDNYFVDRVMTPRDENGEYDFESIEALKLDLFNDHLSRLIRGEEVEMPIFNFKQGCCEKEGLPLKVPPGEPIIIEGIHGLNERLTQAIPREQKFKIYVSALTQLNIDNTNRIPTTDCRLIRRIVRDNRTRGHNALTTIRLWPSVRRGEERNIFPFQEDADVIFNSSLVYELSVLRNYAEPLLLEIDPKLPEYLEAKRLLKFLSYFRPISGQDVPPNSILREFIGGSWFKS